MPDALPLTGLFGKVPAHGDFVRRGLPTSFVAPWDAWLQQGMEVARERLGPRWADLWDSAPPWRFALPAGACGPDAVAGVMLPSQDMVGRRFPITLVALLPQDATVPVPAWFAVLEAAALAGRAGQADADALAAAVPDPRAEISDPRHVPALPQPSDPPASNEPDALDPEQAWAPTEYRFGAAAVPGLDEPAPANDFIDATGQPSTRQAEDEDLLAIFAGAPPPGDAEEAMPAQDRLDPSTVFPSMATPAAPDPAPSDGTLAFLLGEGAQPAHPASDEAATPEAGGGLLPGGAADAPDPLALLIAAGETPLRAAVAQDDDLPFLPANPMAADAMPSPPPAFEALPAAEAPPPPAGGGWWTGGGAHLPPSIRALPVLLSADDFASLLEADA